MNTLTIYLAAGAILFGVAHGSKSEECGDIQKLEPVELIAATIGWPAAVVSVVFYDFSIGDSKCEGY